MENTEESDRANESRNIENKDHRSMMKTMNFSIVIEFDVDPKDK